MTRQSIHLRKDLLAKKMDARVKPGHDDSAARRAGGHGGVRTNGIGSTSARERRGH
jgi:hypothetical protein